MKKALGAVLAPLLLGAALLGAPLASASHPGVWVDMNKVCKYEHPDKPDAHVTNGGNGLNPYDPYALTCINWVPSVPLGISFENLGPIDVQGWCDHEYGRGFKAQADTSPGLTLGWDRWYCVP